MKLNILMLHDANPYFLKRTGMTFFREVYTNYLPRFGHSITWVFSCRKEEHEHLPEEVDVYPIPYSPKRFLLGKIFREILLVYRKARIATKVVPKHGCSIVQTYNEITNGLIALYIAKKYKIPFVFQMEHPVVTSREFLQAEGGKYRHLYYLWARLFGKALVTYIVSRADLLVTEAPRTEGWLKRGIEESKIMGFHHGVNTELFSLDKTGEGIRKTYNLNDSKVIIYAGTLNKQRLLDVLIRAFSKIRKEKGNVKLLMVGDGTGRSDLERLAAELGVKDDVVFTGLVPYPEMPDFIAAADIAVSAIPPFDLFRTSYPAKLPQYMAMAKPVVANEEIIAHKEEIEQSGGGVVVTFTAEAFARAVIELLDNADRAVQMGQRGREWVVKNRSYETLAHQLEGRFLELLEKYGKANH